ncbi:replication protein [Candidatus Mycoplasma haematohominis]|uniref:Uncharacterized protein n=1 Tax=Candidatus Mycoplasma haematohominis TaxID=1494318 RepID=A0A478FPS7_9MOLU|nr:replication protein [Candidatus Mycoplasma haemohominis]GCE63403.1 hypothetical protein MHSWG343_03990 [Candidatus Mycoplasma haemohominis]
MPKLGTALVAGGSLGAGGTLAYNNTIPKNIQEALEREGVPFIKSISDVDAKNRAYKAVYLDNKSSIETDISEAKTSADVAYSKISEWCNGQLNSAYSRSVLKANQEKIIKYCSDQVPRTVEGRLQRIKDQKWIKDEADKKDEAYKAIFAIYRYDKTFLAQINSVKGSESANDVNTDAEKGYETLKTWCETNFVSEVKLVEDENLYSYVFWWCKKLDYETTVEEKIQHDYPGWEKESETSGTNSGDPWDSIKGLWQHTYDVFSVVNPSYTSKNNGTDIGATQYLNWCRGILAKKIFDKGVYQKEYLVAKSVCLKREIQYKLGEKKSLKEGIEAYKANGK